MAASLVSTVLNQLVSVTLQQVKLLRGVDEEVQNLTSNIQDIQAVLQDAEERQVKEAIVKRWLEKLTDVSYDIDDVLDEWNTAVLKQDAEKKVWSSSNLCSGFCFHQVCLKHGIALKIKQLNVRLAAIANEKNAYNFVSRRESQGQPQLITSTTSVIDVSEVFGREQDTNDIKTVLLNGNGEGASLRIISLVGMGGLGKTTLARLAFNDTQVKSHFDKRIWVCVSDPFDERKIAIQILESLGGDTNLVGMENILEKIGEGISGKKLLLVLDDVWMEDSTRWEALKSSLRSSASLESRILLTTRKERVAMVMGSRRVDMISIESLSEEGCWQIFTHLVFSDRPSEECKSLEDVGRKIVENCKGLPLAVKTIGSLLRFKKTKEEWQRVLDSEMWEIKEVEEGVFHPLLVSYYDLPSVLRQCFSFCAIFPEDYVINKDELIKLWMAQGFLDEIQHKEMEIVGEEYFRELAMRSFFQDFVKDKNDNIVSCKLHDLVHSFARFLTKKECFLVKIEDDSKKTRKVSLPCKTIRHSFLQRETMQNTLSQ